MIPERKILLSGGVQTYFCELVLFAKDFGILKYIIHRSYDINGIKLYPGDITYALYWTGRPYTLYIWHLNQRKDKAYYFNIVDRIFLKPTEFIWRDLMVDILVDPSGNVHTLDENELPHDLDVDLSCYIQSAKSHILREYREIIREADIAIKKFLTDTRKQRCDL